MVGGRVTLHNAIHKLLLPRKLTCPLKGEHFKRQGSSFSPIIFGGALAISFRESNPDIFGHAVDGRNPATVDR